MSATPNATAILDRVYLEVRCKLLEVAASLDRIHRADGHDNIESDPRLQQLLDGIAILGSHEGDRAERIQMLFSDPYVPNWNRHDRPGLNGTKPANRG
ncbi:MAG: hypothetical protein EXS05_18635 [Planctomycetaceae bacterium]|nr:hypothetical protein [Planctomycetaceae bacterium]